MMLRRYDRAFIEECEPHVITIQRMFRGYNARAHEISRRRKEKYALKYIVRFLRRRWGLFGGPESLRGAHMATVIMAHAKAERERKAATTIQRMLRGFHARKTIIAKKRQQVRRDK